MSSVKSLVSRFVKEEDGASLVEYGLLVALIAVACIAAMTLLGTKISALFGRVGTKLDGAGN